jgi:repressor LexA
MTHRQIQTLRFISEWIRDHGFSPSLQEIAKGLGGKSVSTVHGLVEALQNRGLVSRLYGMSRSLEVTEKGRVAFLQIEAKNWQAVMQL